MIRVLRLVSFFLLIFIGVNCASSSAEFEDTPTAGVTKSPRSGHSILVQDSEGNALAGVKVCLVNPEHRRSYVPAGVEAPDFMRSYASHGQTFVTDQQGQVRMPFIPWKTKLVAEKGRQFGALDVDAYSLDELVIEMQKTRLFVVRVVDDSGKPAAGIRVLLNNPRSRYSKQVASGQFGYNRRIASAVTNAKGMANLWVDGNQFSYGREGFAFYLEVEGILVPRLMVPVNPEKDEAEVTEIKLPKVSQLLLRPLNRDGSPCEDEVVISVTHGGRAISSHSKWNKRSRAVMTRVSSKNEILIPAVTPDIDINIRLQGTDFSAAATVQESFQTAKEGLKTITMRFPGKRRQFVATLLDPSGEPLRNERIRFCYGMYYDGRYGYPEYHVTDGDGKLVFAPRGKPMRQFRPGRVVLVREARDGAPRLGYTVQPMPDMRIHELGAIKMVETPVLISGQVFDSTGWRMRGLRLTLDGAHIKPIHSRDERKRSTFARCRTDRFGKFIIYDDFKTKDYTLRFGMRLGSRATILPIVPGQKGVRVVHDY